MVRIQSLQRLGAIRRCCPVQPPSPAAEPAGSFFCQPRDHSRRHGSFGYAARQPRGALRELATVRSGAEIKSRLRQPTTWCRKLHPRESALLPMRPPAVEDTMLHSARATDGEFTETGSKGH